MHSEGLEISTSNAATNGLPTNTYSIQDDFDMMVDDDDYETKVLSSEQ